MKRRHETPRKRRYTNGQVRWLARYTGPDGKRRIAKPDWNAGKGTFERKADAQWAIDEAYDTMYRRRPDIILTGDYAATWTERHPRSERTNATNDHRVGRVLDVDVEGRPLRAWPLADLRRRHALELVDHMLRVQGRAPTGVVGILRSLSAMAEDAITDEVTDMNPFRGVRVRANDPRATKGRRQVRVWQWEQMHAFAAHAGSYEPMIRCLSDCGLRLGELLPLRRADFDGESLTVRRTAHEGKILAGTKTDHGELGAGRVVPVPPSTAELIRSMPPRIDTDLLFPTTTGKLWRQRNFYRDLWYPTQRRAGIDPRPHEFRHSYVSLLRAAGVDDADLADAAGHTVETMLDKYTHGLGRSADKIRGVIG